MQLLHKLVEFGIPQEDLINIYVLYVRSILEQSCQVWHSSLTFSNSSDLERVQKNALKIILKESYHSYSHALKKTNLKTLNERRKALCLRFAKNCTKYASTKNMFPENNKRKAYKIDTRKFEQYQVTNAKTERLKVSAIPYMQNLLNNEK